MTALRPIRQAIALCALATSAACADSHRALGNISGDFPVLALAGVSIGTTAADFRRAKPTLTFEPHIGFQETRDSGTVTYAFAPSSERLADDSARVDLVAHTRRVEEEIAYDAFRAATAIYYKRYGAAVCMAQMQPASSHYFIRRRDGATIVVWYARSVADGGKFTIGELITTRGDAGVPMSAFEVAC